MRFTFDAYDYTKMTVTRKIYPWGYKMDSITTYALEMEDINRMIPISRMKKPPTKKRYK